MSSAQREVLELDVLEIDAERENLEQLRGEVSQLASDVLQRLGAKGLKLATAESLTGGLLAATLVAIPGASQVFVGGVTAYDTAVKRELLGVDGELLRACGPVCAPVAAQMVVGVCAALGVPAQMGIATTGVAGPDPDPQTGQLPGTVFVAVGDSHTQVVRKLKVRGGGREAIRLLTVRHALQLLLSQC